MYVYLEMDPGLFTVGFYDPTGKFITESSHSKPEFAAERVHYLNGGEIRTQWVGGGDVNNYVSPSRLKKMKRNLRRAAEWNKAYPIGTPVRYYPEMDDHSIYATTRTRSEAQSLDHHSVVVDLVGFGVVSIAYCQPIVRTTESSGAEVSTPLGRKTKSKRAGGKP